MKKLNLDTLNYATSRTTDFVKNCQKVLDDTLKEQRLAKQECRYCFYNSRIAGNMFKQYNCLICNALSMWHNTAVPQLCTACAQEHELCVQCGASMNEKRKNKIKWSLH
jgi:hypothetical protein